MTLMVGLFCDHIGCAEYLCLLCRSVLPPAPDAGDPPGLRAQVMQLFEAFVRLLDEAPAERQHTQFVLQLRELDLLKVRPS